MENNNKTSLWSNLTNKVFNRLSTTTELQPISPLYIGETIERTRLGYNPMEFSSIGLYILYSRIFTNVISRLDNIPNEFTSVLYNNSNITYNQKFGLIHYLVESYLNKEKCYIYIEQDNFGRYYLQRKSSKPDVSISNYVALDFTHYEEPYLMSSLMCLLHGLDEDYINVSRMSSTSIYKLNGMREFVSIKADADEIADQIGKINSSIKNKNSVSLDSKDDITLLSMDIEPVNEATKNIYNKMSMITGLPTIFLGYKLESTYNADTSKEYEKLVHEGLRRYAYEVVIPVVNQLFNITSSYVGTSEFQLIELQLSSETELTKINLEKERINLEKERLNLKSLTNNNGVNNGI